MPFYLIEQRGVPGARLVEGDKPASALNHVIDNSFTIQKVDGRELLDAVKKHGDPEVAGAPIVREESEVDPALQVVTNGNTEVDPDRQREDRDERAQLQAEDNAGLPPGHDEFGPIES